MKKPSLLHTLFWAMATLAVAFPALADDNVDLLRETPVADSLFIKRLAKPVEQGNAQVTVTFKKDRRLEAALKDGNTLEVQLDQGPVLLRDDGKDGDEKADDGVFSAIIKFDFEEFAAQQKRRAQLARKIRTVPVFAQRQLIEKRKLAVIDPRLIRAGARIDLGKLLGIPAAVNPARELMITDVGVVNDSGRTFDVCTRAGTKMGRWTFGHLMTAMANQAATGIDPRDFTREWLAKWEADQAINGFTVPQRLAIQTRVINPWPLDGAGKLDLSEAPMRLLAIVNRVDLRSNPTYGGNSAGEARLVFGVIDRSNGGCNQTQFTVIFEYGVKKKGCKNLKAWAQLWHSLGALVPGTAPYNNKLQTITDQFTEAGADPSKLPNKSALNQLRSNEIALGFPWELREFNVRITTTDPKHIDPSTAVGHLAEATVKQTPSSGPVNLNNTAVISDYINANQTAILNGTYVVPLQFPGTTPFLGGASANNIDFWNGSTPIANNDARFNFSLNACDACHGRETNTTFLHIAPRGAGSASTLSGFLTGITVADPVSGVPRAFNDLARRAADLDKLINSSCLVELLHEPMLMVH